MDKIIKLTEDDIHSMIKECVSNILKEGIDNTDYHFTFVNNLVRIIMTDSFILSYNDAKDRGGKYFMSLSRNHDIFKGYGGTRDFNDKEGYQGDRVNIAVDTKKLRQSFPDAQYKAYDYFKNNGTNDIKYKTNEKENTLTTSESRIINNFSDYVISVNIPRIRHLRQDLEVPYTEDFKGSKQFNYGKYGDFTDEMTLANFLYEILQKSPYGNKWVNKIYIKNVPIRRLLMKDGGKIVNSNMSFDWNNIEDIKRLEEILKKGFAREISSFEIYNEPFNDISITAYNNNNAIIYKTVINLLAQNDYKLGEDYTIIDNIFYRLIPEWVKFQSVEEFGLSKEMLGELIKENPMMWKLSEDGKNVLFNKRINIFKKQNNGKANNKNNRK